MHTTSQMDAWRTILLTVAQEVINQILCYLATGRIARAQEQHTFLAHPNRPET